MLSRSNDFVHVQMYSLWTMQGKCHSLFISQFPFVLFTVSWGSDAEAESCSKLLLFSSPSSSEALTVAEPQRVKRLPTADFFFLLRHKDRSLSLRFPAEKI